MSNKVALVSGGAVRIGRAISLGLAKEGFDVAIHYNASQRQAVETKEEIERLGRKAEIFQADLISPDAPADLIKSVEAKFGSLSVLVNSASTFPEPQAGRASCSIEEETLSGWEETLAVNTRAPFFLIQASANLLKESQGLVVNILDSSVHNPYVSRAAHSISKSALKSLTEIAAKTFLGSIRVNALELGAILPPEGMPESEKEKFNWLGTEGVVSALLNLVNTPSINGEVLRIDGGQRLFSQTLHD